MSSLPDNSREGQAGTNTHDYDLEDSNDVDKLHVLDWLENPDRPGRVNQLDAEIELRKCFSDMRHSAESVQDLDSQLRRLKILYGRDGEHEGLYLNIKIHQKTIMIMAAHKTVARCLAKWGDTAWETGTMTGTDRCFESIIDVHNCITVRDDTGFSVRVADVRTDTNVSTGMINVRHEGSTGMCTKLINLYDPTGAVNCTDDKLNQVWTYGAPGESSYRHFIVFQPFEPPPRSADPAGAEHDP